MKERNICMGSPLVDEVLYLIPVLTFDIFFTSTARSFCLHTLFFVLFLNE